MRSPLQATNSKTRQLLPTAPNTNQTQFIGKRVFHVSPLSVFLPCLLVSFYPKFKHKAKHQDEAGCD